MTWRLFIFVPLILVSACRDLREAGPVAPDGAPSQLVLSGETPGRRGFRFLPPMAASVPNTGEPDGTLQPVVSVCEWDVAEKRCVVQVAGFTRSGGSGSETIRYDATEGSYIVNWHTDRCIDGACTLDASKVYRVRVLVGSLILGHADVVLAANAARLRDLPNSYIGLVNGRTLPVRFRIEQGAVTSVGGDGSSPAPVTSAGAVLATPDGGVTLDIPSGAVSAATAMTMEPAVTVPEGAGPWSQPMKFGPAGTQFVKPVDLTMSFDPTMLPEGVRVEDLEISLATADGWLPVEGSVIDDFESTVTAPIEHFSTYAITIRPNTITGTPTPTTLVAGGVTSLSGYASEYRTSVGQVCYWERYLVFFKKKRCYSVTTVKTYPSTNAVYWNSSNPASVSVPPGPTYPVKGTFSSPTITGVVAGAGDITARTGTATSAPVRITVIPSLVTESAALVGAGQRVEWTVGIPQAQPSDLVVTLHNHTAGMTIGVPGTTAGIAPGTIGNVTIPAGQTSARIHLDAGDLESGGRVAASAPGYGGVHFDVSLQPGRLEIGSSPIHVTDGQSTQVTIRALTPDGQPAVLHRAVDLVLPDKDDHFQFIDGTLQLKTASMPLSGELVLTLLGTAPGATSAAIVSSEYGEAEFEVVVAAAPVTVEWRKVQLGHEVYALTAVWGADPDNVVALNHYNVFRLQHGTWTGTSVPHLNNAIWGTSMTDIHVLTGYNYGQNVHWNGSSWVAQGNTTNEGHRAIWGVAADEVYALGSWGGQGMMRWDGSSWTLLSVKTGGAMNGMLGFTREDMIAVGNSGAIRRFDGSAWMPMGSGTTQHLRGIWGTSRNDIWVVGHRGTILRYNGSSWSSVESGVTSNLNGIGGTSSRDIYAVGDSGVVLHYNGATWRRMATGTVEDIQNVFAATSPSRHAVYAVATRATLLIHESAPVSAAHVSITPTSATLNAGESVQLAASALGSDGSLLPTSSLTWTSSDEAVATVDLTGRVTGVSGGNVIITVARDGVGASASITVRDPLSQVYGPVAGGYYHACAITADGGATCWTNHGPSSPPGLNSVTQVAAGFAHNCALRTDGTVFCWDGSNAYGERTVPADLQPVAQIAAGMTFTCALQRNGRVRCWGDNTHGQTDVPLISEPFRQIDASGDHACGVLMTDRIVCWGRNVYGAVNVPADLGSVTQVAGGRYHTCALKTDGTVRCWGYWYSGTLDVPAGLGGVSALTAANHTCALKADGSVVCWGDPQNTGTQPPAVLPPLSHIAASGSGYTCGRTTDGYIICWGYHPPGIEPAELAPPVHAVELTPTSLRVAGGTSEPLTATLRNRNGAAVTGFGVTWSSSNPSVATVTADGVVHGVGRGEVVITASSYGRSATATVTVVDPVPMTSEPIAAGFYHACSLRGDGQVVCWGSNVHGEAVPPAGLGPVRSVTAGFYHTCALRADSTVTCWGENRVNQTAVPGGLGNVVQVAAGYGHTCALRSNGTVACWGDNEDGHSSPPAELLDVVRIASGGSHSCAVKREGTVVCWGRNSYGQSTPPAGLSDVVKISAGNLNSCALKRDGQLVCWGYAALLPTGETPGLSYSDLALGYQHACALTVAPGSVHCWGAEGAATEPPQDLYGVSELVSGGAHSCARSAEGLVLCWGAARQTAVYPDVAAPDEIRLNLESPTIEVGQTVAVTGMAYRSGSPVSADFSWGLDNEAVAAMSDGKLHGISPGTTYVTATAGLLRVGAHLEVVAAAIARRELFPAGCTGCAEQNAGALIMREGPSHAATYEVHLFDARGARLTDRSYDWSITDTSVVTVTRDGDRLIIRPGRPGSSSLSITDGPTLEVTVVPSVSHSSFAPGAALTLVGATHITENVLRLTPSVLWQRGAAWAPKTYIRDGFATEFQFRMHGADTPADGFAFLIQSQAMNAIGEPGSGMGYQGLNALAVEFDVWHNTEYGEPADNHVSIQYAGVQMSRSLGAVWPEGPLAGTMHTARIVYSQGTLMVFLNGHHVLTRAMTAAQMGAVMDANGEAWVGFAAGTGSVAQNHDILNWQLTQHVTETPAPVPAGLMGAWPTSADIGATVQLSATLTPRLFNRTITFSIDGTAIGTAQTDHDGTARLPWQVAGPVGSRTVTASVIGTDEVTAPAFSLPVSITPAPIVSSFDTNTEGWTAYGDATGFGWTSSGGNPGGHIRASDQSTGVLWGFVAPAAFRGAHSAFLDRYLSFDLRQSATDSPTAPGDPDIMISGGGITIVRKLPANPGTAWTPYRIPLTEGVWRVGSMTGGIASRAQMQQVMSSVTDLRIRGEYRNGADTGYLDNVIFGGR